MSAWRDRFEDPRAAIGGEAISADAPAGNPVRDGDAFSLVEDELRKLETEGPTAVHWPNVRDRTLAILRDEGKDLLPACWLCYALFRSEGFPGLATGLLILDGMCTSFWDELQPPPQRARGRANVFDWLSERVAPLVDQAEPTPQDDLAIVTAFEAIESLMGELDQKLSIDTTLAVLLRAVRNHAGPARERLERAEQEAERAAEAAAGETVGTDTGSAAPASDAAAAPAVGEAAGTPATAATPSPSPAAPVASAPAMPAVDLQSGDVERVVSQLADAMQKVARQLRQTSLADPRAYSLLRSAIWSRVMQLPDVEGGRTPMPAPDTGTVALLEQSFGAGGFAAVVEQAEELQGDSPFFLTASRWASAALRKLGSDHEAAADMIDGQTAVFLRRYPELASMSFVDGTPFADAETVSWIQSIQGSGEGGGDPTAEAAVQAKSLLAAGKGNDAMALLAKEGRTSASGRERFLWRLAQASLCLEAGRIAEAVALTDALVEGSGTVDLADHEPALVARAAEIRVVALQHEAAATVFPEEELARRRNSARVDLVKVDAARAFACSV